MVASPVAETVKIPPRVSVDVAAGRWLECRALRPALVILLLPVVVFAGALLPGKVLSPADNLLTLAPWRAVAEVRPANPLANDVTFMFHPWLIYTGREIAEGRFPLWNPYGFGGAPFFANPQTAVLFPLNWLAWILPAAPAVTAIAMLKLSLAGLGAYWLLRLLAVGRAAATLGALSFMWSGVLGAWLPWSYGSAIACLPLVLAVTERLRQRPGAAAVAALGLTVAVTIFAGYPQGAAQALLATVRWALTRARSTARPGRFLGLVGGGLALGLALAAVQILPALEYLRLSAVFQHRAQWFPLLTLPLRSAVTFLMPYYYGGPGAPDFWGYWNFNEIAVSVGLVPWLALPLALLAAWRRPGTRFFVAMAAVAGGMLYGVPLLTPWLARLPPFAFTVNHRLAPFLALALSALAALGLDAALRAPEPGRRRLARTVRIAFLALAAAGLVSLADDLAAMLRHPMRLPLAWQYVAFLVLLSLAGLYLFATGQLWAGIAVNLVRDRARNRRFQFWRNAHRSAVDSGDTRDWLPDGKISPEERASVNEQVQAVWDATKNLSERQRTVFLLRFVEDLDILEIAEATGLTENAVNVHLFRAVRAIRKRVRNTND